MEFFSIGVYNCTEKDFFEKLTDNKIDTFCDIRHRRGVRGSKYSFVNSNKLQEKLNRLGINYGHVIDLAPTQEIRDLQKSTDLANKELKSERQKLGETFVINYNNKILNKFNFDTFFENLDQIGSSRIVLFCVEEFPEACHRSIVANVLHNKYHYKITHL
jgi:uncharacterized protein (DUF488 family)